MKILVTGAAGLIGGEVCARLLAAGHHVTAITHRNPDIVANDGSPVAVQQCLSGDVAKASFGWDCVQIAAIAAAHDLLLHCAATTRFDLSEADYHAVNVQGTAHAINIAQTGAMRFLHVSTAYVCGTRNGPIGEQDDLPKSGFTNGYEASKACAEALVASSGLGHAIARPSIVVGDSRTGAIRIFDTIYMVLRLIADGRIKQMPARPQATLDFVPIDHVAAGIAALVPTIDDTSAGCFHLVSGKPTPVSVFASTIAEYPQCQSPVFVDPDAFDPASLPPLERRLYGRVAGLYAGYFQRDPRFDDRHFRAQTGLVCPDTGLDYLRRLMEYCLTQGFIKS